MFSDTPKHLLFIECYLLYILFRCYNILLPFNVKRTICSIASLLHPIFGSGWPVVQYLAGQVVL